MALKAVSRYNRFDHEEFFKEKDVAIVTTESWMERVGESDKFTAVGTKSLIQIVRDDTDYGNPDITNFGRQFTVKTRDKSPSDFAGLEPFTQVEIVNVERASLWGEHRNNLSMIADIVSVD